MIMPRAKNSKGNIEEKQRQRTCATSFKPYHGARIIKITGTGQGQTNGLTEESMMRKRPTHTQPPVRQK